MLSTYAVAVAGVLGVRRRHGRLCVAVVEVRVGRRRRRARRQRRRRWLLGLRRGRVDRRGRVMRPLHRQSRRQMFVGSAMAARSCLASVCRLGHADRSGAGWLRARPSPTSTAHRLLSTDASTPARAELYAQWHAAARRPSAQQESRDSLSSSCTPAAGRTADGQARFCTRTAHARWCTR